MTANPSRIASEPYCFHPFGVFSSAASPDFAIWRTTIESTDTFKKHVAVLASLSGARSSIALDPVTHEEEKPPKTISLDALDWVYVEAFARCFCQWIVRQWRQVSTYEAQAIADYFHQESMSEESKLLSAYWTEQEMAMLDPIVRQLFTQQTVAT